jgi:hypothetical protein
MSLLQETCQSIQGLDLEAKAKAQERNNNLAKPVGSLGKGSDNGKSQSKSRQQGYYCYGFRQRCM